MMEFFRRYLTTAHFLSWPVVALSVGLLLSGHLLDTPLNGTENVPERAALLVANQAAFFLVLWGWDRLVLRRVPETIRWVGLWGSIAALAAGFALAFTWQLWQLGFAAAFDYAPRIRGWLISLAVMSIVVAIIYGLVAESARLQRQQTDVAKRIARLESMEAKRLEADAAVVADLRSQLEEVLAPGPGDSAEKTLHSLRVAIDEIIRPVIQVLGNQGALPVTPEATRRPPISWRKIASRFPDFAGVAVLPGAVLFVVSSFPTVSTLMGVGPALTVLGLIFLQLTLTTFILTRLKRFVPRRFQAIAVLLSLVVSSGIGGVVFWPLIPWGEPVPYFLAFIIRYTLLGALAVIMAIAFDENRQTSELVAKNKADVDWALARAYEVDRHQNQLLATVLHGKWQAVLAGAAARLQIALRDGVSAKDAVASARADTGQLSLQELSREDTPRSLEEAVSEAISLWEGVADVSWKPAKGLVELVDADPVCSRLCGEIILELCTNAIKHAGATHITVSLRKVNFRLVRVEVRNNGEPYRMNQPGYGSRLLEHSCVSWNVGQAHGKTIVSADVPWSAH